MTSSSLSFYEPLSFVVLVAILFLGLKRLRDDDRRQESRDVVNCNRSRVTTMTSSTARCWCCAIPGGRNSSSAGGHKQRIDDDGDDDGVYGVVRYRPEVDDDNFVDVNSSNGNGFKFHYHFHLVCSMEI